MSSKAPSAEFCKSLITFENLTHCIFRRDGLGTAIEFGSLWAVFSLALKSRGESKGDLSAQKGDRIVYNGVPL